MRQHQENADIRTSGRGFTDVTARVQEIVTRSGIQAGVCLVFCTHTSAAVLIQENADPDVLRDLLRWLDDAVPDGDPRFRHVSEGPDDMPAHVRATLLRTSESIPVRGGSLTLGTWQAIYLAEHRRAGHSRRIVVHVTGE